MPNKKITIEQLDEGYLILADSKEFGESENIIKKYAKESQNLIPWLEKFFDIEIKESKKKS